MNIAVIGSGISGLSAAYLLSSKHEVDLFESEDRPGGHTRTIDLSGSEGSVPVDTGFLVYNLRTYPLLIKLFSQLGVQTQESNMSFSVYLPDMDLAYNGRGLSGVFFQKKNLFSIDHYRMVRDILTFNKRATRDIQTGQIDESMSLGTYLSRWSKPFRERYLYPMGASIWSSPVSAMEDFPALAFLRFFYNHGLLTVTDQPTWRTVTGGAIKYVKKMLPEISGRVRINDEVTLVKRTHNGVLLDSRLAKEQQYDRVIFATHPPDTLRILQDADTEETEFLGSFRYRENLVITHHSTQGMYRDRKVWSSWNYVVRKEIEKHPPVLTYWINLLQNPPTKEDIFVTLNDPGLDREGVAKDRAILSHPLFDSRAIQAQKKISNFDGRRNVFFCGAWLRNGFHEDGLWSANRIAEGLGCGL